MCGIFCLLCADQVQAEAFHLKHIEKLLSNRGPDCSKIVYRDGMLMHGAVLWQQGDEPCGQPVESEENLLLFNGDLYMDEIDDSDTRFLFKRIEQARSEDELMEIFKAIVGPFSIICYFKSKLYFARDSLGRNSLIFGKCKEGIFLTSVLDPAGGDFDAIELPPLGVYSLKIDTGELNLFAYQDINIHEHNLSQLELLRQILPVKIRHQVHPDWLARRSAVANFSFDDLCKDLTDENVFKQLLENSSLTETSNTFIDLLTKSVQDRIQRTPNNCKNCIKSTSSHCPHSNIGILFSGGVDCSMLAILADKFIEPHRPIDLMNVAFEKVNYSNQKTDGVNWNVPDRLTGLDTVDELRRLRPERSWNFIEINITRTELNEQLKKLSSLVFPLANVLDESLGAALYFASRGIGFVDGLSYSSPCRVILMGSGADELFGGYTRHRNAFRRSTPDRDLLLEELNLDWARLPSRNLARDDRVIADNGITVRAPFVEENFVNFVQQLSPLQRCYPALPEGVGDKLLLRICAHRLGLKNCSKFKKRALQFGSRIADKRQSAKDTSKLLANGLK